MVFVFRFTYPYLNDFIHISNTLLSRYLNTVTKTIEQNVPDEEVVPMLDLANQLALISKLKRESLSGRGVGGGKERWAISDEEKGPMVCGLWVLQLDTQERKVLKK